MQLSRAFFAAACLTVGFANAQEIGGGQQQLEQDEALPSGADVNISPATVRRVQQALNNLGYTAGNVDGILGPQTTQALRNFQQASGLEPTGNINRGTLAALDVPAAGGPAGAVGGGQAGGQTVSPPGSQILEQEQAQ